MPQHDEKHVKVCRGFIVWDAITRPEQKPDGGNKYSLKIVVPSTYCGIGDKASSIAIDFSIVNQRLLENYYQSNHYEYP